MRWKLNRVIMGAGLGVLAAVTAAPAETVPELAAQGVTKPLPAPFVSGLDLECYRTPGPALNAGVVLTHLNPVLVGLGLPAHTVILRELQQTCVPVMKNGVAPPADMLPFIRHVDLACYRVDAAPLPDPVTINLRHLNPVFANLPEHAVTMVSPAQLCVPVMKNGVVPPPDVLDLVRYIDLECYRVDPTPHPVFGALLRQLNPQLTAIPDHPMTLGSANRQLCVPVRKNNQVIPPASLDVIRWLDLEKFRVTQAVSIPTTEVVLGHLNPMFATLPPVSVKLELANSLLVPVAKNGQAPPP
ncbi:MAG TPA: hypothetical protein VNO30_35340 [Kofleriaceae bacterium]|nr:hypothetical protein [Kofleriaceae bacterium]